MSQLMTDGARRIVMVSGHYENSMMLHEGIDLSLRGRPADGIKILNLLWVDLIPEQLIIDIYPGQYPGVALEHAAFLETSILLYLRLTLSIPSGPDRDRVVPALRCPSAGAGVRSRNRVADSVDRRDPGDREAADR